MIIKWSGDRLLSRSWLSNGHALSVDAEPLVVREPPMVVMNLPWPWEAMNLCGLKRPDEYTERELESRFCSSTICNAYMSV